MDPVSSPAQINVFSAIGENCKLMLLKDLRILILEFWQHWDVVCSGTHQNACCSQLTYQHEPAASGDR